MDGSVIGVVNGYIIPVLNSNFGMYRARCIIGNRKQVGNDLYLEGKNPSRFSLIIRQLAALA